MKIRLGFFANSSSSSFIITLKDDFLYKNEIFLKKNQIIELEKFGFKKTQIHNPYDFEFSSKEDREKINEKYPCIYYGYDVTCNQDEVIEFLVKHRIPFRASIHYSDYTYIYDGGDRVYSLPNYGNMFPCIMDKKSDVPKMIGDILMENGLPEILHITNFMDNKGKKEYINNLRNKKPSKKTIKKGK